MLYVRRAVVFIACVENLLAYNYQSRADVSGTHDVVNAVPKISTVDQKSLPVNLYRMDSTLINKVNDTTRHPSVLVKNKQTASVTEERRSTKADFENAKRNIRVLVKRWSRTLFACHCTGFHVECHSNSYCSWRYGRDFKCHRYCCGTTCKLD